jgi:hypothetical protein
MLLSEEPVLDHVYSGLPTIGYPSANNPDGLVDYLDSWGVSTALVGPRVRWSETRERQYSPRGQEMAAALDQLVEQGRLTRSVSSPDGMLRAYRVVREANPL